MGPEQQSLYRIRLKSFVVSIYTTLEILLNFKSCIDFAENYANPLPLYEDYLVLCSFRILLPTLQNSNCHGLMPYVSEAKIVPRQKNFFFHFHFFHHFYSPPDTS